MSQPSEYPEQLDDQSMGSQSNGLPAVAPVVPSAIEEPGSSLVPQEVHPPQEALFGDTRIFIHAPQFHWHDYGLETMDVDCYGVNAATVGTHPTGWERLHGAQTAVEAKQK